ncbi:MAG TPA: rhodanese-like domain-containing protein [Marmoricola sp.]|nr:rhodanese-like domain-containing protein [Marmoricola sp.]
MEHFRRLDVAQARHALAQGAVLVDVREDFEWAAGHVPEARHIPLRQLAARIQEIPDHRPVLVVCRSGRRSAEAARTLAGPLGVHIAEVANVEGGMVAWAAAGFPVVGDGGASGAVA